MRDLLRGMVIVWLCTLAACFSPELTHCPAVDCPKDMVCDGHGGCALPEQISQCSGRADGTACSYRDRTQALIAGACAGGLCVPVSCGNGIVSPDELCDDGNNNSGDGCSADCRSLETCGNAVTDAATGEQCDDGNTIDGDGCQHDCKLPRCGDGVKDGSLDEECDAGAQNANTPDATCRPNCQLPRCGDGVADPGAGEVCDDGNNASSDGCSGDCKSNETCGNRIVDALAGEVCDDGNAVGGDGCSADCRSVEVCGNGVTDTMFGEVCDDGNTVSGDGCSSDCRSLEVCGNGIIDTINEQCDLGALNSNSPDSGCRTNCKLPVCGDTIRDPMRGEQCDDGVMNADAADSCRTNCQLPRCGDRIQDSAEVCDDGNTTAGDGCSSDCRSLEVCGNSIIDAVNGEQCDNGAANSTSPNATCRPDCTTRRCGDAIVDGAFGELCDLGGTNSNAANASCRTNCAPQRCGDGVLDDLKGEVCDDGNIVSGDDCSADCKSNETCGNGIVDTAKGEQCDAGAMNSSSPDAPCRPDCKLPRCGDGIVDATLGEACDLGGANSNSSNAACRTNCQPQRCGDTIVDGAKGEVCDDGNTTAGDGCSPDCTSNESCGNDVVDVVTGEQCDAGGANSDLANAPCRTDCKLPRCGDAAVDTVLGEACDLGVMNSNGANATCRLNCQPQRCGDTIADDMKGEVCDDGNVVSGDGCAADCKSNEICGNGIIDVVKSEQCDNGGLNSNLANATCRTNCTRQSCGDSIVDNAFGELCDLGAMNSNAADATCRLNCTPQRCGDGILDGAKGEVCDDGNNVSGDDCSSDCKSLEICGNGIVDTAKGEQCDDANGVNNDQCHDDCTLPRCGDGIVDFNEQCDAGAANSNLPNATCRTNCVPRRCGDTIVDNLSGEVCDDGNVVSGDNCSGDCRSNETCGNGVLDPQKGEICDDGNSRGRDGCSGCAIETALVLRPGGTPAARESNVLVYDAGRRRVVMFGGWSLAGNFSETWEWDGVSWTRIDTAHAPAPRLAAAAAYDVARKRIVLFGGYRVNYGDAAQDTWEYDGVDWTPITPTGPIPSGRAGAAMAYDANRRQVIMFGGAAEAEASTVNNETWAWNGTSWTLLNPSTKPGARAGARMAFDSAPTRKYIVMYGGEPNSGSPDNHTWTFDGTNWTDRGATSGPGTGYYANGMAFDANLGKVVQWSGVSGTTHEWSGTAWTPVSAATPPAREHVTIAYDAARKQIVMFGGATTVSPIIPDDVLGDTWVRTGQVWSQPAAFAQPPARYRAAMTYDPLRKKTVLFGGQSNASTMLGDTWEWDGSRWTNPAPAGAPSVRAGMVLDYDTAARTVRLYGGDAGATTYTDVYSYTGSAWSLQPSAGRTATKGATMSYDAAGNRLVTFGGLVASTSLVTDETWTWTAAGGWALASPAFKPPARDDTATAYDPIRNRTVLFGGDPHTGQVLADLWEWNGASWAAISASGGPGPRIGHRLFYNPDAARVCVYGASTGNEDLWEWTGSAWQKRALSGVVPSKYQTAVAYHGATREVVAFGGADATNTATAGTVMLRYQPNVPTESCVDAQIDYDRDGRLGCADDECWSACTPLCPPGAPCSPTAPRCGDGTCNPFEDCLMCPADCGACAGGKCGDFHCDTGETSTSCPNDC